MHERFHRDFLKEFFDIVLNYLEETLGGLKPVINFKQPEELRKAIDFSIPRQPTPNAEILEEIKRIMDNQIRPYHPHFHNQLYGGFDELSLIGNILTSSINGTMFTYEVAPVYTLMENYVYDHLRGLIGWTTVDGMMTPGGSFANWMGIQMARHHRFPQARAKGIQGLPAMKLLTSAASHYSIEKGAILQGFGTDNIIKVRANEMGEMIPEELEREIQEILKNGEVPLFVNSTAGTSVSGAIDPIEEIGEICKKYGVWHHVDGAFGGALLLTPKHRNRLGDLSNVDSLSWDPHKALMVPLQATFFLCRHVGLMESSNSTKADYLFHKERNSYSNDLDTGDKSLQCGRVIDILKIWTYFKGNGWNNIAGHVERELELATYLTTKLQEDSQKYIVVYPASTFNVGFYYVPLAMRDHDRDESFFSRLSRVTVEGKKVMIEGGKVLIAYATNGRDSNYFWRQVFSNPFISAEDVDYELGLLAEYCEESYAKLFP